MTRKNDDRGTECEMRKELCKPCMLALVAQGKTVRPAGGRCEKITCSECGRRRFGSAYEVTGRKKRKEAAE